MRLAGGISIRFPRVTKIREDKSPDTATNLQELQHLYAASKQHVDFQLGELSRN
jgi:DNA ligase-3